MTDDVKATVEELGPIRRKISVTIPAERVTAAFQKAYRDLSRKVVLPGYRRGHVPERIVRQMYAEEVKTDVARDLVGASYQQALETSGLVPLSDPVIKEFSIEEGQPLAYAAELEVRPTIVLPSYRGISLVRSLAAVTEEDVTHVLDDLRHKVAPVRSLEAPRPAASGDVAVIDFEGTVEGAPIPGGKGQNFPLSLGTSTFIPGFEEAVSGMSVGDEKSFTLAMPADYANEELAGKEATFAVTLKEIKERIVPAMDDDFARDLGNYESLADLRVKVRADLEGVRLRESRGSLKQQAEERLLEGTTFEVPDSLVDHEEQAVLRDYARRLAMRGLPVEEAGKLVEDARKDARTLATRRVKLSMILDEIARAESIEVAVADQDKALRELADSSRKPVAELRRELIKSGAMEGFRAAILEEKTLDFVLEQAAVTDGPAPKGGK